MSISCLSTAFRYFSVMRFNLFFQTHWQNCTFSALLSGCSYYIYFEINSYNRSSWSKQIFAVALCLYKLRCSSNTSKWSLSCCPHCQKIRKSIKNAVFQMTRETLTAAQLPHSQGMPFAEAHQTRRGQNQRQSCPTDTPRAAIHSLFISFTCLCW